MSHLRAGSIGPSTERRRVGFPSPSETEAVERGRVTLPLAHDLHPQPQEDLLPEHNFELAAGPGPDGLEHRATLPDDDAFLRLPFHEHQGVDTNQIALVGELLHLDLDR